MDLSIIILTLAVVWLGRWAWCLGRNYIAARSYGLPILICPIDPDGFPYVVFKVPLRPLFKALLPKSVYDSFQVSIFGWQFLDKHVLHSRIGPVFTYVTPGDNELWISDPVMAHDLLSRRRDFGQPAMTSLIMSVLGPNTLSVSVIKSPLYGSFWLIIPVTSLTVIRGRGSANLLLQT